MYNVFVFTRTLDIGIYSTDSTDLSLDFTFHITSRDVEVTTFTCSISVSYFTDSVRLIGILFKIKGL